MTMGDPLSWHPLLNTGALAAFAVFVLYALWKIGAHGGKKAFELGERYVASTEKLHDTLKESDIKQKELCEGHRQSLEIMSEAVDENILIQREQCEHLKTLVDLHQAPSGPVTMSMAQTCAIHQDIGKMKQIVKHHCAMCRVIARNEFPAIADQLDEHCNAMERLIQDSGEINLKDLS